MAAWSSHLWFAYIYIHTYILLKYIMDTYMVSSTLIIIIIITIDYSEMCTMERGGGWDGIQEEAE